MYIYLRSKVSIFVSLMVILSACLSFLFSIRFVAHAANPFISLSSKYDHPSASVKINGKAFGASETISITFDSVFVGTATTDNRGAFASKITIPSSALPGTHTIQAIGGTSGLTTSASFLVQTNWALFGFNVQSNHYNPYENVLDSSNVSNLTLDWKYTTGDTVVSSPAVVNGMAYIGSNDGNIYAFNAATGVLLWSYSTGFGSYCHCINSSPSVVKGVVYIGAGDDKLYALNALTGSLIWTYTVGDAVQTAVMVVNNVAYFGSNDDNLYAVNATTGVRLWSFTTGAAVLFAPVVVNGLVYAGSEDNHLYALNATTGVLQWSVNTVGSILTPTVVNGIVYVGASNGTIYAFNALIGTTIWSFAHGVMINTSPAVAKGIAYFGTDDGIIYAFKATTGTLLWSYSTKVAFDSLAVANGVVYAGAYNNNSGLLALNANKGTVLWVYPNIYGFTSTVVVNGAIYVGSYDHNIYVFHLPCMSP